MLSSHRYLYEAGDEVRDAIRQSIQNLDIPDDVFDIEAIVEEVYEDDGQTLTPLVTNPESFRIIVENHRYKITS